MTNSYAFAQDKILVLGDSLSAAYGIDPALGWVTLLEARLKDKGLPYEIVNASVSGYTSQSGLSVLPKLLEDYHPKIVIIALGSNDGLRGIPIATLEQNLNTMVETSLNHQARVLLVGFKLPINYGAEYREQFEAVFDKIAQHYHVIKVPFLLENVVLHPELIQAEGTHPNVAAQPILLDNVWPYLNQLL